MTSIYYIGYNATQPGNFIFDIPEGHHCWLLVITHTPAEFWVNGEMKEYPANSAVLYPPHHKILYRACTDLYANDWVRFDSSESYLLETTLPLGVPFSVQDPDFCHKLFQLLYAENLFNNNYKELSIDYLFRVLFHKLHEASHYTENSPHFEKLIELHKEIHNNPGYPWTITNMSNYLHLSKSYMQILYKSTFGISCMEDVIKCRIQLAKEQLINGTNAVNVIAARCGYTNEEHFYRQFRHITSLTPLAFRKLKTNKNELL